MQGLGESGRDHDAGSSLRVSFSSSQQLRSVVSAKRARTGAAGILSHLRVPETEASSLAAA